MAANQARELLQSCSLSCDPGFISHRGPWPGPSVLLLRSCGPGCEDCWSRLPPPRPLHLRASSALFRLEVMLPPKGSLCPSPTIRHLSEFVLPGPAPAPILILPAQISPGRETQEAAPFG